MQIGLYDGGIHDVSKFAIMLLDGTHNISHLTCTRTQAVSRLDESVALLHGLVIVGIVKEHVERFGILTYRHILEIESVNSGLFTHNLLKFSDRIGFSHKFVYLS